MACFKAQNDPWTPLPEVTNGISQPPCDPRYQLIDSDRYIETLERKLKRLQGRNRPEPSSRDIIDSLTGFKDDQMRRYLQNGHSVTTDPPSSSSSAASDDTAMSSGSVSYLQRRLFPERQALYMEELFELLKDDELARNRPQDDDEEGEEEGFRKTEAAGASSGQTGECARLSEVCEKDGGEDSVVDCDKKTAGSCKEVGKEVPGLPENGAIAADPTGNRSENDSCITTVSKDDSEIACRQEEKDSGSSNAEEDTGCR